MAAKKPVRMKSKKITSKARATKSSTSQAPKRALRKPVPIIGQP